MQYNVTYHVNNGEGKTYEGKAQIEFSCDPEQYGNGYSMFIKDKNEPFGGQGYDIRYDKRFHKDAMILYIVNFYSDRYDGKESAWKLLGIRVHEAEFEEGIE